MLRLLVPLLMVLLLVACREQAPVPAPPVGGPSAPPGDGTAPPADAPKLVDVIETDPRYVIGITYPPGIERYPGLATAIGRYADGARAEVMSAVQAAGSDAAPSSPYDLSLNFTILVDSPRIVAVAADGASYTGGAHGNPLVARFVWLPERRAMLDAQALMPGTTGWEAVSRYVREQLHSSLSQRIDAEELGAAERAEVLRTAARMIDAGSEPDAGDFAQFEPLIGPGGALRGLRFVFPPYQVGPYSDGLQTVEVPAAVLLPHVAPGYRDLFAAG